jgi:hypothetical protein
MSKIIVVLYLLTLLVAIWLSRFSVQGNYRLDRITGEITYFKGHIEFPMVLAGNATPADIELLKK